MQVDNIRTEIAYVSANCNRKPHAFDLRDDIILYPSANSICLYDLSQHRHIKTINSHSNKVNRVRWIRIGKIPLKNN